MNDTALDLKHPAEPDLQAVVAGVQAVDVQSVRRLLQDRPKLARGGVPSEGDREQTILHAAIPGDGCSLSRDQLTIVRLLLRAGADPDALGWGANNGFCTPLTMAAWGGYVEIIAALLQAGANPMASRTRCILAMLR